MRKYNKILLKNVNYAKIVYIFWILSNKLKKNNYGLGKDPPGWLLQKLLRNFASDTWKKKSADRFPTKKNKLKKYQPVAEYLLQIDRPGRIGVREVVDIRQWNSFAGLSRGLDLEIGNITGCHAFHNPPDHNSGDVLANYSRTVARTNSWGRKKKIVTGADDNLIDAHIPV